ncbi:TPA: phage tail tape measure protein, partial [Streptococcus suis]|nr:phage tail tape measure protein [Streptococcus suis]
IAEADENTQKFWMAIAGGFAVAYPALNLIGKFSSAFGTLFSTLGKFITKKTGDKALENIGSIGTAAFEASGKTGLLSQAIGLLGNPITWGVLLGGVAVGAIAYFAQQALDARQRTEEWGTAVSKTEAQELSKFKTKVDETNQAMTAFSENGVQDVEAVKVAFQGLVDEITKLTDKELAKDLKIAEQMGMSPEVIAQIKKSH